MRVTKQYLGEGGERGGRDFQSGKLQLQQYPSRSGPSSPRKPDRRPRPATLEQDPLHACVPQRLCSSSHACLILSAQLPTGLLVSYAQWYHCARGYQTAQPTVLEATKVCQHGTTQLQSRSQLFEPSQSIFAPIIGFVQPMYAVVSMAWIPKQESATAIEYAHTQVRRMWYIALTQHTDHQ